MHPHLLLKHIYYAHIFSHLSYCIGIWGGMASATCLNKLFTIQKMCIRTIAKTNNRAHTDPLFKKLHILQLNKILELELLKLGLLIKNRDLPEAIIDLFEINESKKPKYKTRNVQLPRIKHHTSTLFNESLL